MQRYINIFTNPNVPFVGQAALFDTMIDLVVDTLGAIIAVILLYKSDSNKRKFSKFIHSRIY